MSRLVAEISEQPAALDRLVTTSGGHIRGVGAALAGVRGVLLVARGSSDNAARYAQYLLGYSAGVPALLATPSLLTVYHTAPRLEGFAVIAVSQSGQSPDILAVLEDARAQGCPTVAVTNDTASPLAAAATHVVDLCAGPERSVAATKTYVNSLAALALLTSGLAGQPGLAEDLARLPGTMDRALQQAWAATAPLARLRYALQCVTVARGFEYATAFEVALKVKELAGVIAEPYSAADLLHGPIAAVGPGLPVVLIAPRGRAVATLAALRQTLRARGAEIIAITDDADTQADATCTLPLPSGVPEPLTPLVSVLPGQVLAVTLTRDRGADPDEPVGIAKVTRTR